jgi:hypothetical protein
VSPYREFIREISRGIVPPREDYEEHVESAWWHWIEGTRPFMPWPSMPIIVAAYHEGDVNEALSMLYEKNPKLAGQAWMILNRVRESRYFGGMAYEPETDEPESLTA